MKQRLVSVFLAAVLSCSMSVWAGEALVKYSDVTRAGDRDDYTGSVGFEFVVGSQDRVVHQLGIIDTGADGMVQSHTIYLWDQATAAKLAEVIVPAGTASYKYDNFRYIPVANGGVTLKAGQKYVLSIDMIKDGGDRWHTDLYINGNAPEITPNSYFTGTNPGTSWKPLWGDTAVMPTGFWNIGSCYGLMNLISQPLLRAHDMTAANLGPNNGDVKVKLAWKTALNADETVVNPNVTSHYLYLAKNDPNVPLVNPVIVAAGNPTAAEAEYTFNNLKYETAYYWRVYESINNNTAIDPNYMGPIMSFKFSATAVITEHPASIVIEADKDGSFSAAGDSFTPISYQWYKSVDQVADPANDTKVGTNLPTLTISQAKAADEAFYYCVLTNTGGGQATNLAGLAVKRNVAHWSLDDKTGGKYADSNPAAHDATIIDPNQVQFFDGVNPVITSNAAMITATSGAAAAGNWNPSLYSNQITVSAWVKWSGSTANQAIISKANDWQNPGVMWNIACGSTGGVFLLGGAGGTGLPAGTLVKDEWRFIAFTYDGAKATLYATPINDKVDSLVKASGNFTFGQGVDATVWIGARGSNATTPAEPFTGLIDDVQIFNYAMTIEGIINHYNTVFAKNFCVNGYASSLDTNKDCRVDMIDLASFSSAWLDSGLYPGLK